MLAITRCASPAASSVKLTCPACKLPIVGTKATASRAARQLPTASRTSATVRTILTDCPGVFVRGTDFFSSRERVFLGRIAAVLDGFDVGANSVEHRVAPLHEILYEARCATLRDPENVVDYEDLAVDAGARTDADHRHVQ